ncbi:MAG TPA: hypothetical protein DHW11_09430 [Gemmatimonadetes bacterium]|nr:hypothetical protein [Gemmatimonadota bacterium]
MQKIKLLGQKEQKADIDERNTDKDNRYSGPLPETLPRGRVSLNEIRLNRAADTRRFLSQTNHRQ